MALLSKSILILCVLTLAACADQNSAYRWGGYSSHLLEYYKDPQEKGRFAEKLSEVVTKAEAENRVPPGLYAEYGYILLEMDRSRDAVSYFAKEKEKWPESAFLMTKLIDRLGGGSPKQNAPAQTK